MRKVIMYCGIFFMILLSGCIRFRKDTTDTIYLIPEAYEEMVTETTDYKITIGSIPTDSESDSNFVLFINGVTEEKSDELGSIVRQFTRIPSIITIMA
ncbi:hypothetical protein [Bacillus toyonensis]|uniref:hypothetical protein n=1 Tax=Bacillus toyonensis TaxID=155322 RepID=UPI001155C340|nr:hypothetical protein [Bacillus toyonensis]